jgi:hypothetical protein
MPDSPAFEIVCSGLESRTALGRLAARGAVRLALRGSGFDPADVSVAQMRIVLQRVLGNELGRLGVADAEVVCQALLPLLDGLHEAADLGDTLGTFFRRLR